MATKKLTIPVLRNKQVDSTKSVNLNASIFNQKINEAALAQVLRAYIYNSHQQTKKVKTRSSINLTKAKIYRQKGTGRARHGAKSAPIFVGGGITHGPKGHLTRLNLPKKLKEKATKALLTKKLESGKLFLLIPEKFKKPQTKQALKILKLNKLDNQKINLTLSKKDQDQNTNLFLSFKNIKDLNIIPSANLNPAHLALPSIFVLTQNSLEIITKRLAKT